MAAKIYECIEVIGNKIIENKDFLTDLDRLIGDADHGVNMARGFHAVIEVLQKQNLTHPEQHKGKKDKFHEPEPDVQAHGIPPEEFKLQICIPYPRLF